MNYTVKNSENHTVIEVSGVVDRGAVITAASFIRGLELTFPVVVILDVDGLEDEKEMFYHAALINTIKKEIEFAGGTFRIRVRKESLRRYLSMTGLERLFIFDESHIIPVEEQNCELQRC